MKIPAECNMCDESLSRFEMEDYLARCEKTGENPMAALTRKPPGITCTKCFARIVTDANDDNMPVAKLWLAAMRARVGVS